MKPSVPRTRCKRLSRERGCGQGPAKTYDRGLEFLHGSVRTGNRVGTRDDHLAPVVGRGSATGKFSRNVIGILNSAVE